MYSARLFMNRTPTTLSQSYAILQHLKIYGGISIFKKKPTTIQDGATTSSSPPKPIDRKTPSEYYVVYNSLSKEILKTLTSPKPTLTSTITTTEPAQPAQPIEPIQFTISTNTHNPKPYDLDPYNVRGLLSRKPTPKRRDYICTLEFDSEPFNTKTEENITLRTEIDQNEYSSGFIGWRDSNVEAALVHAGMPYGLVKGLRPKMREWVEDEVFVKRRHDKNGGEHEEGEEEEDDDDEDSKVGSKKLDGGTTGAPDEDIKVGKSNRTNNIPRLGEVSLLDWSRRGAEQKKGKGNNG